MRSCRAMRCSVHGNTWLGEVMALAATKRSFSQASHEHRLPPWASQLQPDTSLVGRQWWSGINGVISSLWSVCIKQDFTFQNRYFNALPKHTHVQVHRKEGCFSLVLGTAHPTYPPSTALQKKETQTSPTPVFSTCTDHRDDFRIHAADN